MKQNGALRNLVPTALFLAAVLFLLLPVPAFYAMPCLFLLLVFFHYTPVIAFRFWFFCNFPYTEHLYTHQSVKTLYQSTSINKVTGEASCSPVWLLLSSASLSFIFFYFLGCQTSFDDDKSKDVPLNLPHP